jgi:hypothetical protein
MIGDEGHRLVVRELRPARNQEAARLGRCRRGGQQGKQETSCQ